MELKGWVRSERWESEGGGVHSAVCAKVVEWGAGGHATRTPAYIWCRGFRSFQFTPAFAVNCIRFLQNSFFACSLASKQRTGKSALNPGASVAMRGQVAARSDSVGTYKRFGRAGVRRGTCVCRVRESQCACRRKASALQRACPPPLLAPRSTHRPRALSHAPGSTRPPQRGRSLPLRSMPLANGGSCSDGVQVPRAAA